MAERDQRTEEATPRKKEQMREEGKAPRSADLSAAASMMAAAAGLAVASDAMVREMLGFAARSLRLLDGDRPLAAVGAATSALLPASIPILAAAVAAVAVGAAQTRTFSLAHALPKLERLDPASHLGQMLPGKESLLEIAKQVLKLGAISYVAYSLIADSMPMLVVLSAAAPTVSASFVGGLATELLIHVGGAFLLVAVFDYGLVLRKANEDAMMSKQEVKDERKGEEGSPELRGRVRRRMRELAKNRALADMSKATVLVTNPTHYAVALRYLPNKDYAPLVLAKGKDELALQMREQARRHQVPMVENRALARALFAEGRPGHPIPVELFRAVAEVIAFVMKLSAANATPPMLREGES